MREFGGDGFASEPELLRITTDHGEPGAITVRVAGDLDMCTAAQIQHAVKQQLAQRPRHLCIDLTEVAFLDAAGIHALCRCYTSAAGADCRLQLVSPQPHVHQILHIVGLTQPFGLAAPPASPWRQPNTHRSSGIVRLMSAAEAITLARGRVAQARATRHRPLAISARARALLRFALRRT